MSRTPCLLGIDVGSYETKGIITTPQGEVLAQASLGHTIDFPHPGWAEQDAERVWWHDFVTLCRRMLAESQIDPAAIAGVGASGTAQCVLPLDGAGRPLRPAILYGIDTRAAQEAAELEQRFGPETVFAHCGHHLLSQDLGPRILWLQRNEPEVFAHTESLLTSSSYLVYRLTGEKVIDIYSAYDSAPMFDIHQYRYLPELTDPLVRMETLPRPAWTAEVVGAVSAAAAGETGLAVGTPVIAGTADAAAEALSVGLSQTGDLMIMYGSSTFFIMKTDRLVVSDCLWGAPFLQEGAYAVAAGMAVGGSLTRWFRDQFGQAELAVEKSGGVNAYAALAEGARRSPPGANGLVALPYFSGERTPFYDPQARGVITGLTLSHTREDVYRALLEAVGYGIRHNLEAMVEAGLTPGRCLAVGGGTRNDLWVQMVSDITGVEQYLPEKNYGACYGDAFLAGMGAGIFRDTSEVAGWVRYREVVRPDRETHQRYAAFYHLYRDLYRQSLPTVHALAAIQNG